MMKYYRYIGTIIIFLTLFIPAQAQKELYNNSIKAYEAKDYPAFLQRTRTLDSLRPYHPTFTYNLAAAYALNNQPRQALQILHKVVLMNHTTAFENDPDFSSLQTLPAYQQLLSVKQSQGREVARSQKSITLSEKLLHPEGLAYLSKSKTWLVASIRQKKIVTFNSKTGVCTNWLSDASMLSVFALKPDAKQEFLWVATAAMPQMEGFTKAQEGKAEILKVNIKTRQIVKRYAIPGNHVFGDILITPNNEVIVSDSAAPILYTIEGDTLLPWCSFENNGFNLQGICTNEDGSKLFVADYLKGIAVVDRKTKSKTWLAFPEGTIGKGIDGLLFYKNQLIAVQNGVQPIRIIQYRLNKTQDNIESYSVIDHNRPQFNEPALATIVGNKLYFFANAPWQAYDKNDVLQESKVSNPVLYSFTLE